ncbi:MAG TPA: sigma-70 family RNA polymerase sigma factor [Prolixibacteraceae bacterium]|jgi:RNA polymerase primary sigma factor
MRQLRIAKQFTERVNSPLNDHLQEISTLNLRLVVLIARQYQNKGLSLTNLIIEGNLGLIRAAECFDESTGFKFTSYGIWWIRQLILRALAENSEIVKISLNKNAAISNVKSEFAKLQQYYEREPMTCEIAELMKFASSIVREAMQTTNFHFSTDEIGILMKYTFQNVLLLKVNTPKKQKNRQKEIRLCSYFG